MLKNIRKKLGMSQEQFSQRLGISQSYLSKLENNSVYNPNYISMPLMNKICEEFMICPISVFLHFYKRQYYCPFCFKKKK